MSDVDPYVVRLPERITNPDGTPSDQFKAWLQYDNRWKHDIWQYSGGGTDLFVDLQTQITSNDDDISALDVRVGQNESDISDLQGITALSVVTTGSNLSTTGNIFINCTAALAVTLNPSPANLETVQVTPQGRYLISVDGNGKNINGVTDISIRGQYNNMHIVYYSTLSEWRIV